MHASLAGDLINGDMTRFARILNSYKECSPEVQAIIDEMSRIVTNPDSSEDDREHACDTMIEALMPDLTSDIAAGYLKFMTSPQAKQVDHVLDAEQAAFGERVRAAMQANHVTLQQLGESLGLSQSTMSNILNGNCRPQMNTVRSIAKALDLDVQQLWSVNETQ